MTREWSQSQEMTHNLSEYYSSAEGQKLKNKQQKNKKIKQNRPQNKTLQHFLKQNHNVICPM